MCKAIVEGTLCVEKKFGSCVTSLVIEKKPKEYYVNLSFLYLDMKCESVLSLKGVSSSY